MWYPFCRKHEFYFLSCRVNEENDNGNDEILFLIHSSGKVFYFLCVCVFWPRKVILSLFVPLPYWKILVMLFCNLKSKMISIILKLRWRRKRTFILPLTTCFILSSRSFPFSYILTYFLNFSAYSGKHSNKLLAFGCKRWNSVSI